MNEVLYILDQVAEGIVTMHHPAIDVKGFPDLETALHSLSQYFTRRTGSGITTLGIVGNTADIGRSTLDTTPYQVNADREKLFKSGLLAESD